MEIFMTEKMAMRIENMDTGEVKYDESCFFSNDAEMTTIVLVKNVNYYHHDDNSHQVSIKCLALDSQGNVFCLGIEYAPLSVGEKDLILADMLEEKIYFVKGVFCVVDNEASITLYEPSYKAMEKEIEAIIRQVFKINSAATLQVVN
jgi:hypothetical protein